MHLRLTTLQDQPQALPDRIARFRDHAAAVTGALPGFRGLHLLVDQPAGRLLVVSLWENAAAPQAAALLEQPLDSSDTRGTSVTLTEVFAVAVTVDAPPSPGWLPRLAGLVAAGLLCRREGRRLPWTRAAGRAPTVMEPRVLP